MVRNQNFGFSKNCQKSCQILAILDKKIVTKSLHKLPKWRQIAKSGHPVGEPKEAVLERGADEAN